MSAFRVNTNLMAMNALRNLGMTNQQFGDSVTKLSTGLRINSGADDPAGLQLSEGFRAQLVGIDQALRNNQDAINYTKTAEGALDEVNKLLRDARALAIANSNEAILTPAQKQANQNQLASILSSIDRISQQTQFGSKKLLDGSSGIQTTITDASRVAALSIGGTLGTTALTTGGGASLTVGPVAVKAFTTLAQSRNLGATAGAAAALVGAANAGSFSINGVTFTATAGMSNGQLRDAINAKSAETGVTVAIVDNGGNGAFQFTANKYGTIGNAIQISSSSTAVAAATGTINLSSGANAAATLTVGGATGTFAVAAGDDGLTLKDQAGNVLKLTETGNAAGTNTVAQVMVGAAKFQIGGNAGQTTSLSIGNFASSNIGLTGLDITSAAGATAALASIDSAIETVSKSRGDIGSFMRNVLESNVRSLGVARENLAATDSTIRDTDVAEEMTTFTKLQILQQSGIAVLAQANQAPQSVLSLLR